MNIQELKRNNWAMFDRGDFIEVLPQDDDKVHFLGDECWCNPRIEYVPGGKPEVLIIHEALDGRE